MNNVGSTVYTVPKTLASRAIYLILPGNDVWHHTRFPLIHLDNIKRDIMDKLWDKK